LLDFESVRLGLFVVSLLVCPVRRVSTAGGLRRSSVRVTEPEVPHHKGTPSLEHFSVFLYGVDVCSYASTVLSCYEIVVHLAYHS
jgi:hypothetical protein